MDVCGFLSVKLEKCKEKETIQISKLFIHFTVNFNMPKIPVN